MRGNNGTTAPWTDVEDEWICRHYPMSFPEEVAAALPGRTLNAIKHRASRLGVRKDPSVIAATNSRTNSGRVRTTENRAKIAESLRGQVQSEETRQKRAESLKKVTKRGPDHHAWKGDEVTDDSSRRRARRTVPEGSCAECDRPGTDVHHKDGNP